MYIFHLHSKDDSRQTLTDAPILDPSTYIHTPENDKRGRVGSKERFIVAISKRSIGYGIVDGIELGLGFFFFGREELEGEGRVLCRGNE